MTIPESLLGCLGELILLAGCAVLALATRVESLRERSSDLALLFVAAAAFAAVASMDAPSSWILGRQLVTDPFAAFAKFVLSMCALAAVWTGARTRNDGAGRWSWVLLLASLLSMHAMAGATTALAAWTSLTLASLASGLWIGCWQGASEDAAAALLERALASSIALLGFALLFGLTGVLDYDAMSQALSASLSAPGAHAVILAGSVLVVAGASSAMGMLPWHASRSAAGEREPLPVAAWMHTGGTIAGIALLARFLRSVLSVSPGDSAWLPIGGLPWPEFLSAAAVATMTLGNVAALRETDVRRGLAWLSVAQTGYLLMGLAIASDRALTAVLFHGVACVLALLGALAALAPVIEHAGSSSIESLRGLVRRRGGARLLAVAIATCFLSLAAVPPLAGFEGKTMMLTSVLATGRPALALLAAVNSVIGLLCSLRVVVMLLDRPADPDEEVPLDFDAALLAGLLLAAVVLVGALPGALLSFAERSVVFFHG